MITLQRAKHLGCLSAWDPFLARVSMSTLLGCELGSECHVAASKPCRFDQVAGRTRFPYSVFGGEHRAQPPIHSVSGGSFCVFCAGCGATPSTCLGNGTQYARSLASHLIAQTSAEAPREVLVTASITNVSQRPVVVDSSQLSFRHGSVGSSPTEVRAWPVSHHASPPSRVPGGPITRAAKVTSVVAAARQWACGAAPQGTATSAGHMVRPRDTIHFLFRIALPPAVARYFTVSNLQRTAPGRAAVLAALRVSVGYRRSSVLAHDAPASTVSASGRGAGQGSADVASMPRAVWVSTPVGMQAAMGLDRVTGQRAAPRCVCESLVCTLVNLPDRLRLNHPVNVRRDARARVLLSVSQLRLRRCAVAWTTVALCLSKALCCAPRIRSWALCLCMACHRRYVLRWGPDVARRHPASASAEAADAGAWG